MGVGEGERGRRGDTYDIDGYGQIFLVEGYC